MTRLDGAGVLVTGGASGLGLAVVQEARARGATVVMVDLPSSDGEAAAAAAGAIFAPADVTDDAALSAAFGAVPLRGVVHCAGRGGPMRILDREGNPGSRQQFEDITRVNLVGSFNVLRYAAATLARNEVIDGERGSIVLTASIAAFEGQVGQVCYASSKAGVVGMTLAAARDLASQGIRVNSIAPGTFDTPMLAKLPPEVREALGQSVMFPKRLGDAAEFGDLAIHVLENTYLNGETIRLDGALRMAPR